MQTECDNPYDSRYRPERLLVYDTHPGGIGLAGQVYSTFNIFNTTTSVLQMLLRHLPFGKLLCWRCPLDELPADLLAPSL